MRRDNMYVVVSAVAPRPLCLFISGLEFGGHGYNPLATLLLSEFVCGLLGTAKVSGHGVPYHTSDAKHLSCSFLQEQLTCSRIARVVICGGLLDLPDDCFSDKVSVLRPSLAPSPHVGVVSLFFL